MAVPPTLSVPPTLTVPPLGGGAAAAGQGSLLQLPPEVTRVLLLSNLPAKIAATGENLYRICSQFGPLRHVRVGSDAETKGTALVVYDDIYDAKRARDALNGYVVSKTRQLHVAYYEPVSYLKEREKKRRRHEQTAEFQQRVAAAAGGVAKSAAPPSAA